MKVKKVNSVAPCPVVVRFPKKVIAAIDKAAKENDRSRSSEIRIRVMRTLPVGAKS